MTDICQAVYPPEVHIRSFRISSYPWGTSWWMLIMRLVSVNGYLADTGHMQSAVFADSLSGQEGGLKGDPPPPVLQRELVYAFHSP